MRSLRTFILSGSYLVVPVKIFFIRRVINYVMIKVHLVFLKSFY